MGEVSSCGEPGLTCVCVCVQAETMQLRARDSGSARAVVVEASQGGFGAQATVIVQEGRLSVGDRVVIGTEYGTVSHAHTHTRTCVVCQAPFVPLDWLYHSV